VGTAETAVAPGRKQWGAGIVSRLDEGGSFAAALQGWPHSKAGRFGLNGYVT